MFRVADPVIAHVILQRSKDFLKPPIVEKVMGVFGSTLLVVVAYVPGVYAFALGTSITGVFAGNGNLESGRVGVVGGESVPRGGVTSRWNFTVCGRDAFISFSSALRSGAIDVASESVRESVLVVSCVTVDIG